MLFNEREEKCRHATHPATNDVSGGMLSAFNERAKPFFNSYGVFVAIGVVVGSGWAMGKVKWMAVSG